MLIGVGLAAAYARAPQRSRDNSCVEQATELAAVTVGVLFCGFVAAISGGAVLSRPRA